MQKWTAGYLVKIETMKVLRAFAEFQDVRVGELMERLVQSAFEGTVAFSADELAVVQRLRLIYEKVGPSVD